MEFLIAVGIIAFCFLALGVNIFFRKDGKFPETEVGKNKHMKELGIHCARCEENKRWREARRRFQSKHINPAGLKIDIAEIKGN